MNVDDAPPALLHEQRREKPHVSRKADQVNLALLQRGHDFTIMLGPVLAFRRNDQRGEAETTSGLNAPGFGSIGNNDGDTSFGNTTCGNILGDGFEVRTASGEEDAEILHGSSERSAISFQPSVHHNSTCTEDRQS